MVYASVSAVFSVAYSGGIAGFNDNGTIANCSNNGAVSGSESSGGIVGHNNGTIANCLNNGVVSSYYFSGGIAGYNYYGTIANCYWCVTAIASGVGDGNDAFTDCASFGTAPGTLSASITVVWDVTTTDLLTALNAWVIASNYRIPDNEKYSTWTLLGSANGYPRLNGFRHDQDVFRDIRIGGTFDPGIRFPGGGYVGITSGTLYDENGNLVYATQQDLVSITAISVSQTTGGTKAILTFDNASVDTHYALFGKTALTDSHCTYLTTLDCVTFDLSGREATASVTNAKTAGIAYRFFIVRSSAK